MPQHKHSNKKIPVGILGLLVGVTSILIYYNSAVGNDDPSDSFNFSTNTALKILFMSLSALVGLNEFFEVIDHALHFNHEPHHAPYKPLEDSETDHLLVKQETKRYKNIDKAAITLAISPPLSVAFYGLFTQGESLMQAFAVNDDAYKNLGAAFITLILGTRFILIPVTHLIKNVWGGHQEFTNQVTHVHTQSTTTFLQSLKSRAAVFIIFCGTHMTESLLLSGEISQGWLYILSVIGLDGSRAVSHLDHAAAYPDAWKAWLNQPIKVRTLTAVTSFFSGIAHASSGILSMIYFWPGANLWWRSGMCASVIIEWVTGMAEHMQHTGHYLWKRADQKSYDDYHNSTLSLR